MLEFVNCAVFSFYFVIAYVLGEIINYPIRYVTLI